MRILLLSLLLAFAWNLANAQLDRDGDGMPDRWERENFLNPDDGRDAWQDWDGDAVLNLFEYYMASRPWDAASPIAIDVRLGDSLNLIIDTLNKQKGYLIRLQEGWHNAFIVFGGVVDNKVMIQGGWDSEFKVCDPEKHATFLGIGEDNGPIIKISLGKGHSVFILDGVQTKGNSAKLFFNGKEGEPDDTPGRFFIHRCKFIGNRLSLNWAQAVLNIEEGQEGRSNVVISKSIIADNGFSAIKLTSRIRDTIGLEILHSTITGQRENGIFLWAYENQDNFIAIDMVNTICAGNDGDAINYEYGDVPVDIHLKNSLIGSVTFTNSTVLSLDSTYYGFPVFWDSWAPGPGCGCVDGGTDLGFSFAGSGPDIGAVEVEDIPTETPPIVASLNVFPNPVTGVSSIQLNLNEPASSIGIWLLSCDGKVVSKFLNSKSLSAGTYTLPITAAGLPPGLYFLQLKIGEEQLWKKIVVGR